MIYRSLLRPILFRLPAEVAHELALHLLAAAPAVSGSLFGIEIPKPFGPLRRFGLTFQNPVGLAAGFDKDGVALQALAALGFGFIEAGTVTHYPQPGNKKPRLFRLPDDQALINRAGFNNHGAAALAAKIECHKPQCVLGISIGKSKQVAMEQAVDDYLRSFAAVAPVADYVAVNVSSPNTPGLRNLQHATQLDTLLTALQKQNQQLAEQYGHQLRPLLVKLSPDLNHDELKSIVEVIQRNKIAGLIATNTTTDRAGLKTPATRIEAFGEGGLSGAPLKEKSLNVVSTLYHLTNATIPIIGVGGIFNAMDAWDMIKAGASLIQLYTGFIYEGPSIVSEINDGLRKLATREGFVSLDEAVGSASQH